MSAPDQEIILVADEQGRHTGEYIPKEVGHSGDGRRHLAIAVLLFDGGGRVLLQRRKHRVFDDICQARSTRVGPTARDLARALAAQDGSTTTRPRPVTLDGHDGLYLELTSADHRPARATGVSGRTKPARR